MLRKGLEQSIEARRRKVNGVFFRKLPKTGSRESLTNGLGKGAKASHRPTRVLIIRIC
jgi:hypothetical protein